MPAPLWKSKLQGWCCRAAPSPGSCSSAAGGRESRERGRELISGTGTAGAVLGPAQSCPVQEDLWVSWKRQKKTFAGQEENPSLCADFKGAVM